MNRIREPIAAFSDESPLRFGWIKHFLNFLDNPTEITAGKNNFIKNNTMEKIYYPNASDGTFDDKVGILESHIALATIGPDAICFSNDKCIIVTYGLEQEKNRIWISRGELQKLKPDKALNLFSELEG